MSSNQTIRYVLQADISNLTSSLASGERAANNLEHALKSASMAMGIGYGIHGIVDGIKEAVQQFADYEQSLLRVKNVSENLTQGLLNQQFILAEADKFKIPIEEATKTYGEFLTMVRGSGLAAAEVRKLHDEVLMISKVAGIPQGSLDAGIRNIGKLLEQGTLEARHLRPLTYEFSGLAPYIARELGVTQQQLEKSLSSGTLTKSAIDSKVIINAIDEYSKALGDKLPEALQTTQSSLNELHNEWMKFVYDLGVEAKPALMEFMHGLQDTVHWLRENKEDVLGMASALLSIGKIWLWYQGILLVNNSLSTVYSAFMAGLRGSSLTAATAQSTLASATSASSAAFTSQAASAQAATFAIYEEVAAMEALNLQLGTFSSAKGLLMAPGGMSWLMGGGRSAAAAAGAGIADAEIVGGGAAAAGAGISAVGGALVVALAAFSIYELWKAFKSKDVNHADRADFVGAGYYDATFQNPLMGDFATSRTGNYITKSKFDTATFGDPMKFYKTFEQVGDTLFQTERIFKKFDSILSDQSTINFEESRRLSKLFPETFSDTKQNSKYLKEGKKLIHPNDHITGQRVVTYNIHINEVNGLKDVKLTQALDSKQTIKGVGDQVSKAVLDVINDSQLKPNN